ncbi:MAG: hypothetical protein H6555_04420 [Lewinellaceae bacterium]|nr:hypothetical protein [Lewinellaceae bacterium]
MEKLNYTPRFTQFLQGKLPRLDTLLEQLDRVCSGIFAFAFLVALMFLSLFLYVGVSIVVVSVINNLTTVLPAFMDLPLRSIAAILTIIWLVMGLLYFLDTLTLGYFKRLRYNRLYFMIYRITSWCSGSFLYRALYYHLITNFPRRFIQGFLAFFILILISLPFVKLDYFRFFPDTPEETLLSAGFYDELRPADPGLGTPVFLPYKWREISSPFSFGTTPMPIWKSPQGAIIRPARRVG